VHYTTSQRIWKKIMIPFWMINKQIITETKSIKMLMEINLFGLSNLIPTLLTLVKSSALITSIANIILLIGMLYVYLERYLKVKSKFTTTLVLFSLLFLVQNILFSVYFFHIQHSPNHQQCCFTFNIFRT